MLEQTFKKIESPVDFLIALRNYIVMYVSDASLDKCKPEWGYEAIVVLFCAIYFALAY